MKILFYGIFNQDFKNIENHLLKKNLAIYAIIGGLGGNGQFYLLGQKHVGP